jgi:methyl-accepting chemotaxis protein
MNEMVTGADQINTAVQQINGLSEENVKNIGLLKGEVEKYTVD